jgi:nitrate reductase cytochrome c-type subunit
MATVCENCDFTEEEKDDILFKMEESFRMNPMLLPHTSTKNPLLFYETEECLICRNQISYQHIYTTILRLLHLRNENMNSDFDDMIRYYLTFMDDSRLTIFINN